MNITSAIKLLLECDKQGAWLYSKADLCTVFSESGRNLTATIERLKESEFIKPVAKGLYEFSYPDSSIIRHVDEIALVLRRGNAVIESLESAAAKWGIISQIPIGRTMYLTTGREGLFDTSYGTIEYVHTKLSISEIMNESISRGSKRTRIASKSMTIKNLKATNRSLDLIETME